LFVHKHASAKEAPLNAITALGARVWVRRCDILRPNHQVLSIRQLHYLKVMAAAGTTTAKSTDLKSNKSALYPPNESPVFYLRPIFIAPGWQVVAQSPQP
jgi:hypothetical protein